MNCAWHEDRGSISAAGARVARVAAQLWVGERRLRRRMLASVGYGPKVVARVARARPPGYT